MKAGKRGTKRGRKTDTGEVGTFKNRKYIRTYDPDSEALLHLNEFEKCGAEHIFKRAQ